MCRTWPVTASANGDHNIKMKLIFLISGLLICWPAMAGTEKAIAPEIIIFKSGSLTLGGEFFKPKGSGPFPVVLYNHGSAPGMFNSQASQMIAPLFVAKGWAFFMPYRRGQGLSVKGGTYIGDEISAVYKKDGESAASKKLVELMSTSQLDDQMAALKWLKTQKSINAKKIAVAGNSFGGIQTILGAEKENFCAAVDAAGGAESWDTSPELQNMMKAAAKNAISPIFFFQAANDYNLAPTKILSDEMKAASKIVEFKIYPAFGNSIKDGHSFAYMGAAIWFDDVFAFLQKHCDR
jgi:carboxymethylenebutenolidase